MRGTALLFFLCMAVSNALNYLFNVVMSRALGPAEYGLVTSVLALTLVLSVPASILQTVTARYLAALNARGDSGQSGALLVRMLVSAAVLGLALAAVLALLSGPVAWLLHVDSRGPVLIATVVVVGGVLLPVGNGALQGLQRFGLLGVNAIAAGVARVGSGMLLVWLGLGAAGAIAASGVAGMLAFGIALVPVGFALLPGRDARLAPGNHLYGYAGSVLAGTLAFTLLSNVDVVVVRHFFSAEAAGQYAAASVLGKVALFLPGAVAMLMFPKVAAAQARGQDPAPLLRRSLAATLALGLVAWLPMALWPGFLVGLLFGPGYAPAASLIGIYGLAMVAFGLVTLLLQFYLSIHSRRFVALLSVDAVLLIAALVLVHPSLTAVIQLLLANSLLLLPASELLCHGLRRQPCARPAGFGAAHAAVGPSDSVSVIMPAYNEAERIAGTIAATVSTLSGLGWNYELLVVDDGSADDTYACAQAAVAAHDTALARHDSPVRVLQLSRNRGKGMALRYGLVYATGDLVAFLDADLDLHPRLLASLRETMAESGADIVIGSKYHPQSRLKYPLRRRITSLGYAALVKALFRLPLRDTQTGIKLFRREALEALFPRILIKRYALDLELLVNAQHLGLAIAEAPVDLDFQRRGRIRGGDIRNMLLDTLAIFYRLNILRYYDRPLTVSSGPAQPAPAAERRPELAAAGAAGVAA